MTKNNIELTDYKHLLEESKQTILEAQHQFHEMQTAPISNCIGT